MWLLVGPGKGTGGRVQRLSFPGPSSPPRPFSCLLLFLLVLALFSTASSPSYPHITPIPLRPPPCRDAPRAAAGDKRAGAAAAAAPHRWRPPWRRSRATSPSALAESPGARPGSSTLPLTLLLGATIRAFGRSLVS